MVAKDPELRRLIARKAIKARLKSMTAEQRRAVTAKARATYTEQLRRQVDPDGTLPADQVDEKVSKLRRDRMRELAAIRLGRRVP